MDVRALLLDRELHLTVGDRRLPEPEADEVLVDVDWSGVCGSDLHVLASGDWVAYWPATLGHEVAGTIVRSADPAWPAGTRVVLDSRMPRHTEDGWAPGDRLDPDLAWLGEARPGGFAQATVVATPALHRVPEGLATDVAVLAEPLAVVLSAVDRLPQAAPGTVLVMGYGPIGYLVHAEIRRRWPESAVTVVEPNAERAEIAAGHGAAIADAPAADAYDVVVDAAGFPGAL
ncbi:alcohol dehydrogenase catalytic domain-containing protein, partial [Patulibacter sp. S7RM1-6]